MTSVVIDSGQVDLLISTVLVCSSALAWCLGFLAHEMGAK